MYSKSITHFFSVIIAISMASVFTASAVADAEVTPEKIEGTANPDPLEKVDPDKALLSTIKYPKGMVATLFAKEPYVMDPTAISFDEQNRLYIAETHRFARGVADNRRHGHWVPDDYALKSTAERLAMYKKHAKKKPLSYFTEYSEKIRVVEDRDGDGKSDHFKIFADGFNDPLDGTAAGIMALDGKVYFACIPHVWLLEDTDGDLVADKRESLQEGYGISVSLSGHDLNGFALGPDNRIYFTIGDRAYNLKTKEGKHLYSQYEGACFRMEKDGSNLEVVHTGLRNPKEVAFDQFGNLFSVDNNADLGDKARVVDIIEGAFTGWNRGHQAFPYFTNIVKGTRRHKSPWMEEEQWQIESKLRPRAILKSSGYVSKGPSGLAYNPGTGLSEKWDNHFFVCDYVGAGSAVIGFRMEPDGAGFKVERVENFVSGFLNTDIEFGYDGKAYVSDYVGSWPTHGFGNIFTFHDPKETAKAETKQVRTLFAEGFGKLSPEKLAELLRHPDMRVRLRAQLALAENSANRQAFIAASLPSEPITTRLHGVWGLGNLARLKNDTTAAEELVKLCASNDHRVRGQAVKALGDSGHKSGVDAAVKLLTDSNDRTRMLAAIATGKLGSKAQLPALIELIKANNDQDEFLRHGAVEGMVQLKDADAVFGFAKDKSPAVRLAVTLALRRYQDARIGTMLNDPELSIAVEAAQAINDTYITGATKDLAAATHLLGKATWQVDVRILNSMIRTGEDENVIRLLETASNPDLSDDARAEALWLIGRFENPPTADPTTGMIRPILTDGETRKIGSATQQKIKTTVLTLLEKASGDALVEAIKLAEKYDLEISTDALVKHLTTPENPNGVRLAALSKLESMKFKSLPELLEKITQDKDAGMRKAAMEKLAKLDPAATFKVIEKTLASGSTGDKQIAIDLLRTLKYPDAIPLLLKLTETIKTQPIALHLDIIEAAGKRSEPAFKKALVAYEASIDKKDSLAAFQITLEGGDAGNGRRIFFNDSSANCKQCHKVGNRGGDAGPNLKGLGGSQDAHYIMESIINPSAKLAPGYSPIAITMKDGSIVSGMLMKNTDTEVVVRNTETEEDIVCKKEDIATLPPAVSSMPPMGQILSKSKIRDLVAYLSSLKE